jgi:RNA recognition motif-containing protein
MSKKLYVGNLPFSVTQDALEQLFTAKGEILSISLISDKYTGQSRGFGFVEMKRDEDAQKAIEELNGFELEGRALVVNEARPQEQRSSGGFRERRGGFGGGRQGGRRNRY